METEDFDIINLYTIIKTNQCVVPDCVNEIAQLEQQIEKYNSKENCRILKML